MLQVTRLGDTVVVHLPDELDDPGVVRLEQQLAAEMARTGANTLIVDVKAMTAMDSFMARVLGRLAQMLRLLGARTVVVGIRPAVAISLVELDVPTGYLDTAANVEQGIELIRRRRSRAPRGL